MNVLIIGNGGREHALAWKAAQSPQVERVFVSPGNAGSAAEPKVTNLGITADDIPELVRFARGHAVQLTIVGPEAPLVAGVVDAFSEAGLRCLGPTRAAARLEGSKAFAKDFLIQHGIPTAQYRVFTELEPALKHIHTQGAPIVVKADGLAAGKGVILAKTVVEAEAAVRAMLTDNAFGTAGNRVVIEQWLQGEEVSFIALVDGEHILSLASSQDHKARDDGDSGPNTGGMGAYSPAPVLTTALHGRILRDIIKPTVRGMATNGCPYTGFLYVGLMITADGSPHVLEYNCRLGDPETQPILLRLRSDLVELCEAALTGQLDRLQAAWDRRVALGVVMAAGGYPAAYRKGDVIRGLPAHDYDDLKVFHAGTTQRDGAVVTNGGRVLCVTALGDTVQYAQQRAYEQVRQIQWDDVYYRSDIGHRAIARESDVS